MKKHKYLFVACLSLFPVMAVAGNDTLHEIMEVPSATNINKNRLYKGLSLIHISEPTRH